MAEPLRIRVDPLKCSGCLVCMTVCSLFNDKAVSLSGARVQVEVDLFEGERRISICRQCKQALCAEACPEGAIERDEAGYLVIDYDRCSGCQACVEACPFDAMFWSPVLGRVVKCELCHGDPQCVQVCATGALTLR